MAKKIIITHMNPDLDALCSVWLLKKFADDFQEAEVVFVPAGKTYQDQKVDSNPNVIHVDTGQGKFDHHQLEEKTSASQLVFNYLKSKKDGLADDQALLRLIKVVTGVDNFQDCLWSEPTADYFSFFIPQILRGLKSLGKDDQQIIDFGSQCLNGVYTSLKIKISAEEDLKQGFEFSTRWGKAIGCLSKNNYVLKLGQKQGYLLVVQKDPQTEHIRIKARPDSRVDLTPVKEKLVKLDPQASWYLHISKKMLLNGSSHNLDVQPSKLSLRKTIEVLEKI